MITDKMKITGTLVWDIRNICLKREFKYIHHAF